MLRLIFALGLCSVICAKPLEIKRPAIGRDPWTVAGEHGAVFGRQDGTFEAWLWPVKILSHFSISARLGDDEVNVNRFASEIDVTPAQTTISYLHEAFRIRQHTFASRGVDAPATGVVTSFEIESVRPLTLTFTFRPEVQPMWPAPSPGAVHSEWNGAGFYLLTAGHGAQSQALLGMPGAQGQAHGSELALVLHFNPSTDSGKRYPLVMALRNAQTPEAQFGSVVERVPELQKATEEHYEHLLANSVQVETPDESFNEAMSWAVVSIDQMQVRYGKGVGLVAGYYESADTVRPGYAWFFGRDTLWTTYAINSYGDFALTRRALAFLIRRQRADGKIMHEFSQSAAAVDWSATPYFYASADATPLLVMAMRDYVRCSGDVDYLRQNWEAVRKAYAFTRAHDSDGDGIYDNSEGTAWVESWPSAMPHQEIYLAALDQQSSTAMSELALLMNDSGLAKRASDSAAHVASSIASEYLMPDTGLYAFSRNSNGSLDPTLTVFPSVAWWQGTYALPDAKKTVAAWASSDFSPGWGTRDISSNTPFYDPLSYHQGTVWPLFTGWVALAEYRAGQYDAGFAHLMANVRLTWQSDPGAVTELLSGAFDEPMLRSSSHQMWSSAMVLVPALRGLFGIEVDATHNRISAHPHLPPSWHSFTVRGVRMGSRTFSITGDHRQVSIKADHE